MVNSNGLHEHVSISPGRDAVEFLELFGEIIRILKTYRQTYLLNGKVSADEHYACLGELEPGNVMTWCNVSETLKQSR